MSKKALTLIYCRYAAIIGYWRSGADIYEIAGIMDMEPVLIKTIIENYNNRLTKNYERKNINAVQQIGKGENNIQPFHQD